MNLPANVIRTKHWQRLDDGRVQCDICPRHCKVREGQRGLCWVRGNHQGEIVLTSYGQASGFCIDPVEKKPLNHFLPGTPILSFGQQGCNLTCRFCQNWSISKAGKQTPIVGNEDYMRGSAQAQELRDGRGKLITWKRPQSEKDVRSMNVLDEQLVRPEMIAEAAKLTGCTSVAFTYNDPVIFHEYAMDIADACHAQGIKAVAVSAGYMCAEPRAEFYAHMDAANIDLKGFTERFYKEICTGDLEAVKETLVYLKHETDVWFEITTLLIPDENDSDAELHAECAWVAEALGVDVPLHFSAFHPDWKMRDKGNTPPATLRRARDIALQYGLRYVYVGNVHDRTASSTYCHNCGELLIGRDWYELSTWNLTDDGACTSCGTPCAGVFDGPPGDWGRKRRPIRLQAAPARVSV
jgi:pyruvate formate lyase activating enzyme